MLETALLSVFYSKILPNSVAGAVSVLVILAFRQLTTRWPKGYVRTLWILLLVQLLAPPLFQGSFYTVRDFGAGIFGTDTGQDYRSTNKQMEMDSQPFTSNGLAQSTNGNPAVLNSTGQPETSENPAPYRNDQTGTPDNSSRIVDGQIPEPNRTNQLTNNLLWTQNNSEQLSSMVPNASICIWAVRLWLAGVLVWTAYYLYLYLQLKKALSTLIAHIRTAIGHLMLQAYHLSCQGFLQKFIYQQA